MPKLCANRETGTMYGQNLALVTMQCRLCKRWYALRVDKDDLKRHANGMYVQDACPYLPPGLRELFISQTCGVCWAVLCVDPIAHPTSYN